MRSNKLHEDQSRPLNALLTLFLFSGVSALLYQVVWQRALFTQFGVNIESVSIVVSAFMVGLGAGAFLGGSVAKRVSHQPFFVLFFIEIITAFYGLFSLDIFQWAGDFLVGESHLINFSCIFLLVVIPTLLMGAGLPILSEFAIKQTNSVGVSIGRLYSINTLGAAVACFLSVSLLFPFMGMQSVVYVAATLNLLVALYSLYLCGKHKSKGTFNSNKDVDVTGKTKFDVISLFPFTLLVVLCFLVGFVSLSYEILLIRILFFFSGGMAWVFPLILGEFLIGIALGSLLVAKLLVKHENPHSAYIRAVIYALCGAFFGLALLPAVALVGPFAGGVISFFTLMIGLFWGGLFPILTHFGISCDENTGARVGLLYMANIAGSASGSIVMGFVFSEYLTLDEIGMVVGAIAGVVIILLISKVQAVAVRKKLLICVFIVGVIGLLSNLHVANDVVKSMQFPYASSVQVYEQKVENKHGIITVTADKKIYGGNMYDGYFNTDIVNDKNLVVRAYALGLYHESPKNVLMIGLASGSWAKVIANMPAVERLTIIEINPGYLEVIAAEPTVSSLLSNPKVEVIIDDGRRWLKNNMSKKFDAVISNTSFHYRSNVTNLLSREFNQLVLSRLKEGGTFFYNTTYSDRVQKTACNSAPYGYRLHNHMLISNSPITFDFVRWEKILTSMSIDNNVVIDKRLKKHRDKLKELLSYEADLNPEAAISAKELFIESCQSILLRTNLLKEITDDNMGAEWRTL